MDIHNHILPGIDDGAKTVEDSLELINGMGEFGVKRFIATPHIMHNYYPNTPETIKEAHTTLRNALLENELTDIAISTAAEHMVDDNFENLLDEGGVMPLGKDHLLVEMSFLQASINLDSALEKTKHKGYFPVLAHPERYLYYQGKKSIYRAFKKRRTQLQLNLLSLGEYYGAETHKIAHSLLDEKLIDFAATDLHHTRHLEELKKVQLTEKALDKLLPVLENTIDQFY